MILCAQLFIGTYVQSIYNYLQMFTIFQKEKNEKEKKQKIEVTNQIYFGQTKLELPDNFAQTGMDLQMQLQFVQTYNMQLVHKLNQYYKMAIQYYVNEDPRKANHFQKKLAALLTHPHTLQLIQKKQRPESSDVGTTNYTSNLKIQLNKFSIQSDIVIKSMIEGSNKKVQKSNRLMSQNISSQQDRLKKRMEQRSRSKKKTAQENE